MSPHTEPTAGSKSANRSHAHPSTTQPTKSAYRDELAKRVRAALSGRDVREVRMFGGVSFMVDGRMAVAAGREGDLLVRIDPARYDQLLQVSGAQDAVMGADRPMGPGWIRVERPHLETSDELSFWIQTALEYHAQTKGGS